jgi:hypothetical protein
MHPPPAQAPILIARFVPKWPTYSRELFLPFAWVHQFDSKESKQLVVRFLLLGGESSSEHHRRPAGQIQGHPNFQNRWAWLQKVQPPAMG